MPTPCHYLLVDDNPADHLLVQEAFELLGPGHCLTWVQSGQQALQILNAGTTQPDVVLLDINMPGMDGFEVLEAIKRDPRLRTIPVVMLSTSSAGGDVNRAYRLFASAFLVKSARFDAFLEQIEAFLNYWQTNRVCTPDRLLA
ncbi:response regulator [Deinococcus deserti]|uniref:Putative response regulator, CheY n=1 Tax=Deinococcus deserti (strain DSM 17065 / CIP 109153 / LMG 22923 / VCD115) TaxID=546414 RepID=C1D3P5_DEIDV|nr:response regulator [Deinococcus deserti]ACO48124.1 putative response regulator, CheY [Deinococcus deserti VCD115]